MKRGTPARAALVVLIGSGLSGVLSSIATGDGSIKNHRGMMYRDVAMHWYLADILASALPSHAGHDLIPASLGVGPYLFEYRLQLFHLGTGELGFQLGAARGQG